MCANELEVASYKQLGGKNKYFFFLFFFAKFKKKKNVALSHKLLMIPIGSHLENIETTVP